MSMSVPGDSCRTPRGCNPCNTPNTGCVVRVPGECSYYSGTTITGPGINTGDTFNTVINKLVNYVGSSVGITANNGLTTSTLTNVQLGSSNINGAPLLHNTYINQNGFGFFIYDGATDVSLKIDPLSGAYQIGKNIVNGAYASFDATSNQFNIQAANAHYISMDGSTSIFKTIMQGGFPFLELDAGNQTYRIGDISSFGTGNNNYIEVDDANQKVTFFKSQLRGSGYGTGLFTGTPAYTLQVDSTGNIIEGIDEWVSVTDYGAKGDGVTDDTAAIQAALNSGAKLILFPQGTYNITSTLRVSSNTVVFGYGATLFRAAAIDSLMINNSNGTVGLYGANQNIKILGLRFNGNRSTFSSNATLLAFGHSQNIEIKDCEFFETPNWHCIELNAVKDALVEGCHLHDSNTTSELLQLDLMFDAGVFPWFGPYDSTPCNNIIIQNNTFYNGTDGIGSHTAVEGFSHTNILITNNVFRNLTGIAIKPYNYQNVTITSNMIDSVLHGIRMTSFISAGGYIRNYIITDNKISNCGIGNPTEGRAIVMESTDDLVISNNSLYNINRHAIGINFCNRFIVDNNLIKDFGITSSIDAYGIVSFNPSNNGRITNNILTKSTANPTYTVSIVLTGAGVNMLVEDNLITTPGGNYVFTGGFTGTNIVVGTNNLNGKVTPYASTITTNYTYLPTDSVLNVDTTAGNITITVNPSVFNKQGLIIKKTSSDANTVTITPSTGTINGLSSITLTTQDQTADIKSDWVNLQAIIENPATGANNGLSLSSTNVVLGQNVSQVGNPGILTSDREIPTNGFNTFFSGTGSLGIGTTSLTSGNKLQVNGNAGFSSIRVGALTTFTDAPISAGTISSAPFISFYDSSAASNAKIWEFGVSGNNFSFSLWDDAVTSTNSVMDVQRSGVNVSLISFPNGNWLFGSGSPVVSFTIATVDAIKIPLGSSAQRPTGGAGYIRGNSSIGNTIEYYDGATWQQIPGITSGVVAPSSTPSKVGDIYVDTSAAKLYFAKGNSSSADWVIAN